MKNKLLGVLLAILLGLVATIPWILIGYFGWIASIAGYVIGLAAYKGYVRATGKFDKLGKVTVAIVILLAIPFAEIVNTALEATKYGYPFLPSLLVSPIVFIENIKEYFTSILMGYFMAGLGTYQFFIPAKEPKTNNQSVADTVKISDTKSKKNNDQDEVEGEVVDEE